jgi:hypothetical protein
LYSVLEACLKVKEIWSWKSRGESWHGREYVVLTNTLVCKYTSISDSFEAVLRKLHVRDTNSVTASLESKVTGEEHKMCRNQRTYDLRVLSKSLFRTKSITNKALPAIHHSLHWHRY